MFPGSDLPTDRPAVPFARDLAAFGERPAVVTATGVLSYRELAERVAELSRRLGDTRRLVLIVGSNDVGALVGYLAALAGGHPVLLVPGDRPAAVTALTAAYDPDVVLRRAANTNEAADTYELDERRPGSAHSLHRDLALLLSTSGSTGAPKLVRLSHENVQANAESIATYLSIGPDDRAATTLPMHYCYGLSVINSHLLRGASLLLTNLSVADGCFWTLFNASGGTTFAGVPYTFDLLDRVGFAGMSLPSLRYVTQAGGRLAPERVRRYAEQGRRDGWQLFVMYGQTEATARMAYLPPELAESRPQAIGRPIPGGSFLLRPLPDWPEPGVGELVYTGPNVMLGYAESAADLRLGRTVHELPTGDVAQRGADGLYELIGRRTGFVKLFGLRIEPQQVEAMLAGERIAACCFGDDSELVVATDSTVPADRVRRLVASFLGLPPGAVRLCVLSELPRLPSGKVDLPAVQAVVRTAHEQPRTPPEATPPRPAGSDATTAALCRLYAEILDRDDVTADSTFVGLGGDSLSYVELSVRIEQVLGQLPTNWHVRPIRDLVGPRTSIRSRWRRLEATVALRAVAIVLIVGSHIPLFTVKGGAHLLLGVAGFNFARFHLNTEERRDRLRRIGVSIGRIAVPSMLWIALVFLVTDQYNAANLVLLNSVLGPKTGGEGWHFWFIEALVYLLIGFAALLGIPAVDRLERRYPFGLPLLVLAAGLLTRYDLVGLDALGRVPSALVVFWLFAIGWAAAKATSVWHRLVVTVAALGTVPGFFGDLRREAVIAAGLAILIWVHSLPSLAVLNRVAGVLGSSTLAIYLVHWQVFPHLTRYSRPLALFASLAAGVALSVLAGRIGGSLLARGRRTAGLGRAYWHSRPVWWTRHRPPAERPHLVTSPVGPPAR